MTTAGEKYNVYSVGYLKEDGYIIETGFERFLDVLIVHIIQPNG